MDQITPFRITELENKYNVKLFFYKSDSGDRDLGKEEPRDKDISFVDILEEAIKGKYTLISRTFAWGKKPGSWYLKGKNYNLLQVKEKVEENRIVKPYNGRQCCLIEYFYDEIVLDEEDLQDE